MPTPTTPTAAPGPRAGRASDERADGGRSRRTFVDAHHHFQDLTSNHYPWLQNPAAKSPLAGDLSRLKRNYLAEDLAGDLRGLDLVKSVHVQNGWDPSDPAGETRWLQAESERTGLPTAIVGFADLSAPDVESLLEAHRRSPGFRGIRQILKWHEKPELSYASRPDLVESANWRRGYALLQRFGLSFDAQLFPQQMGPLAKLAADFPNVMLIVGHAGMPINASPEGLWSWEQALRTLARQPNVAIKLSGFGLYGGRDWSRDVVAERLLRCIDIFGVDRCMVGSNLPVETLYSKPQALVGMVDWLTRYLSVSDADAICRFTAERIYRI